MTRTITRTALRRIGRALQRAFIDANQEEHVEPIFNEAAEGEGDSGGITPAEFHKGILPGIRDVQTADNIANKVLHSTRQSSANFSKENLRSVHIQ